MMPEYVCRKCLSGQYLSQNVTMVGWEAISPHQDRDKPHRIAFVKTGEREAMWDSTDSDGFYCSNCDTKTFLLEELVGPRPLFECRACGFRGGTDDHPESCSETPERVDAPEIGAGQQRLST